MIKKEFLFLIFSLFAIQSCCQEYENLDITFKEIGVTLQPENSNYPDTIVKKISEERTLELILLDKTGKSKFKMTNKERIVVQEGIYNSSLGRLSYYAYNEDLTTGDLTPFIYSYYQPIPAGVWRKYNEIIQDYETIDYR